jgi:pyruvate/2-oxoglutarate dehydrogenase complex dihydrolipoamide acyltransferase (E2) component
MNEDRLLEAALERTGDSPDSIVKHRIEGDEFVLIVDRGILGGPKFRFPLSELRSAQEPESEPAPDQVEIDATGAAEELAAEAGLDLAEIEGTGVDGRVLKGDVQRAIEEMSE